MVEAQQRFPSPLQLARELGLSQHQIRMALAYYELHPGEVDEQIGDAAGTSDGAGPVR